MEHHGRTAYFVVGEGVMGADGAAAAAEAAGTAHAMEIDLRAFRFERVGPKAQRVMPQPLRRKVGLAMTKDAGKKDSAIPAGYTYLGQFVDHDLTFDKSKLVGDHAVSVATLVQGRSPSLDLDSLYGLGPVDTPEFYNADKRRLKVGATAPSFPDDGIADKAHAGFDLPRAPNRSATIPDARNDENLAVAQTHLAFIRFHNRVVAKLIADGVPTAQVFTRARELVILHYQWMLRTDFLPRIVRPGVVDAVFDGGRILVEPTATAADPPAMPVEFSVAAYRLGHSMVRGAYDWNHVFDDGAGTLEFLFIFSATGGDLGSADRLPSNWIADFRRLYDFTEAGRNDLRPILGGKNKMNVARRIDTLLANPLAALPDGSIGGPDPTAIRHNLAFRNLTRARMLQLASGQQMAALLHARGATFTPITRAKILAGSGGASLASLNAPQRNLFAAHTPLWFYILREAEHAGGQLTGVGARIVAETFHRAMEASTVSIFADPAWRPTLGPDADTFRMVDLLLFAFEGKEELLNPLGD